MSSGSSYHQAEEDELLSVLKTEAMIRTASLKQDCQSDVPRNSAPALAAGAYGKFASAVAEERGQDPRELMRKTKPALNVPDEDEINAKLHELASEQVLEEFKTHGGLINRHSVAAKMQSAADKYDHMQKAERQEDIRGQPSTVSEANHPPGLAAH